MRTSLGRLLLPTVLLLGACQSPAPVPGAGSEVVPGELVVKFQPGTDAATRTAMRGAAGVTRSTELLPGIEHWVTPRADAVRAELAVDPRCVYAEANQVRHLQGFVAAERASSAVDQWYLGSDRGIGVEAAWARSNAMPGAGVVVAVVDTGVDITHPDLRDRIATTSLGVKRFIDEVGLDTTPYTGNTNFAGKDGNGHGTHVAGIMAATAGNGGTVGVAPGATILPVKVMKANGDGDDATIARGLIAAADGGADVINFSVGGPLPSQVLADALAYDMARGVTVVIASGNYAEPVYYPASSPGVIAVGATTGTPNDPWGIAYYSNRGPELGLVAPGGEDATGKDASRGIYNTLPSYDCYLSMRFKNYTPATSPYGVQVGTSMATPIVSGVAALVIADARARGITLSPAQVRTRLLATARPLAAGGFSAAAGYGIVDPLAALLATAGGPVR